MWEEMREHNKKLEERVGEKLELQQNIDLLSVEIINNREKDRFRQKEWGTKTEKVKGKD